MKKAVKILLAILMVACLALTVMACNKECKPGEHQWKDVRTIKVASCKEEGSKEVECEKCGKTDTQPIAKLAHTPQDVEKEDATCGEAGHQAGTKCSVCGETISGMEVIEATGNHTFVYTMESYDDTQHWKVCSVCGAQDTKANHQFDDHLKCECGATDVANAVARINGVKYRSVAAAVTEATAGQTIVLLKNATLDEVINIEKAVTIDLNGKNVTKSANNGAMFVVGQNGKLTIKGEGNVTHSGPCEYGSSNYIVNAISNGEVIIEGGTYEVLDCTIVQVSETAKVAIKGGHFAINENCSWGSTYLINKKDGSGTTVAISGGTFIDYDPSHSNSENPEENFVVDGAGIKMTEADGVKTYVVCTDHQYVASVCSVCDHEISDADVITALFALAQDTALEGTYKLTGVIKSAKPYDTQYKNREFVITVNGKDVTVYRAKNATGSDIDIATLGIGDTVTVVGTLKNYKGTKEFDSGCNVSEIVTRATSTITVTKSGEENGTISAIPESATNGTTVSFTVTVNEGYKSTVTIDGVDVTNTDGSYSFVIAKATIIDIKIMDENEKEAKLAASINLIGDSTNTEVDASKKVFAENGITVTNNKESSTTAIAVQTGTACQRFYQDSTLTIDYTSAVVKIVITLGKDNKVTESGHLIITTPESGATVAVSGTTVTITFAEPVNSVTFKLAKQLRADKIDVYTLQ